MDEMEKPGSLHLKVLIWEKAEVVKVLLEEPLSRLVYSVPGAVTACGVWLSPMARDNSLQRMLSFGKRCLVECSYIGSVSFKTFPCPDTWIKHKKLKKKNCSVHCDF